MKTKNINKTLLVIAFFFIVGVLIIDWQGWLGTNMIRTLVAIGTIFIGAFFGYLLVVDEWDRKK